MKKSHRQALFVSVAVIAVVWFASGFIKSGKGEDDGRSDPIAASSSRHTANNTSTPIVGTQGLRQLIIDRCSPELVEKINEARRLNAEGRHAEAERLYNEFSAEIDYELRDYVIKEIQGAVLVPKETILMAPDIDRLNAQIFGPPHEFLDVSASIVGSDYIFGTPTRRPLRRDNPSSSDIGKLMELGQQTHGAVQNGFEQSNRNQTAMIKALTSQTDVLTKIGSGIEQMNEKFDRLPEVLYEDRATTPPLADPSIRIKRPTDPPAGPPSNAFNNQ